MANKKYKLTDGNMWATDGIHDFGQNKTQRTINSEVNTALGGKAPTNHASTSTTYGKGTSSNYGHVKISDSLTDTTPAATGGVVPSMKAVSDLNGAINDITSKIGNILEGASTPVTVSSGNVTEISSITIPTGNWVMLGSFAFTPDFNQTANGYIMIGSSVVLTVRGTGTNGGTFAPLTAIITGANNTTVTLKAYQSSGSDKTATSISFRAIRIS